MTTNYKIIKKLAERSKLATLLEWLGLKGKVSETFRLLFDSRERERYELIRRNFEGCREIFRAIVKGAPQGDPGKLVWMIGSMHTVWGVKLECVLSLAVRLAGHTPVGVHTGRVKWIDRYHRLFSIEQSLNFDNFHGPIHVLPSKEIEDFVSSQPTMSDLMDLTYRNVDIGRIALSNYMYQNKFAKLELRQPNTMATIQAELLRVQRNIHAAEKMLERCRPVTALVLEKGISPTAEIFAVCIANGIPVVQYTGSQNMNDYILKRLTLKNRLQHPFSLDESTWTRVKEMPWGEEQESKLMTELADSYKKGTWFNRRFLQQGKAIKSSDEVRQQLGLDSSKKTAVIFSHILWDATFFYGKGLFDDYETWLIETVRAACKNPQVNWVVKLHPDLVWKLKYEGYSGELQDAIAIRSELGSLPAHVKLVSPDTDISTFSLFEITNVCVTVRGTIGIEMACHGIPVLTAGTGRYSNCGFTIDSRTREEYFDHLAHAHAIPPLSPHQTELARRFAYTLFKQRPWPTRSIEMVKMPMEKVGHPLDTDIIPRVSSFEEFASATDMREFADWFSSKAVDYLR